MKSISIRDFQLKANDYLNDLPLTLTRYGKPVAIISPVSPLSPIKNELPDGTMPPKIESIKSIEEPEKAHGEEWGYCEGHYQKSAKYERKLVTVEDNNGTEVLTRKWLCPRCIEKLEANVGNYGGHIDYL